MAMERKTEEMIVLRREWKTPREMSTTGQGPEHGNYQFTLIEVDTKNARRLQPGAGPGICVRGRP